MTVLIAYQNALKTALQADSTLVSQISGIFDYFPANQALPYVAFGESSETPNDPVGAVTGNRMSEVTMTIDVVNSAPGSQAALTIVDRIEAALDVNLSLARGTAVGRPELKIIAATQDQATGLWKIPVEVRQLVTSI